MPSHQLFCNSQTLQPVFSAGHAAFEIFWIHRKQRAVVVAVFVLIYVEVIVVFDPVLDLAGVRQVSDVTDTDNLVDGGDRVGSVTVDC
jgi:hypothetical protein